MKHLRPAFTIIEILISVIILSLAIIPVLKMHTDNKKQIVYIMERNKRSLQDSLYVSKNILLHHQDNKTAYETLQKFFKINKSESREILKKTNREIFIAEEIKIHPLQENGGPTAIVNEIMLKNQHSSRYYHFNIESF